MKKSAQSTVEFVLIFGTALFFFLIFMSAINLSKGEKIFEKKVDIAKEIVLSVKNEIGLAHRSSEGYYREFFLPETILGQDYYINITEGRVYLKSQDISLSYKVLNVTGNLIKGLNSIRKNGGVVYLNK